MDRDDNDRRVLEPQSDRDRERVRSRESQRQRERGPSVQLNSEDDIGELGLCVGSEERVVVLRHEVGEVETSLWRDRAMKRGGDVDDATPSRQRRGMREERSRERQTERERPVPCLLQVREEE
jgi:hypothetical protein